MLYRYLGTKEGGGGTDPVILTPEPGDRVLLCSDGVTDGADDETICSVLSAALDPQAACVTLVEAAKEGGSRDNITALVIFVTDDAASE